MDKEDLEKMFDDKFSVETEWKTEYFFWAINNDPSPDEIKQFIFETIIPEVLKNIIIKPEWFTDYEYKEELKQQAKELYWIDI